MALGLALKEKESSLGKKKSRKREGQSYRDHTGEQERDSSPVQDKESAIEV